MNELDKIKSTITISLGAKNRLRKLKGSQSYEDYINYLVRLRNQTMYVSENRIEIQRSKRTKGIYSFENFKILFSYNRFNNSANFIFDIKIETIRENGQKVPLKNFIRPIWQKTNMDLLTISYKTYFELLSIAIQNEIEPLFKHNGRFEDYFSWEEEFKILNLGNKSFEEDVMDKLKDYGNRQGAFE